MATKVERTALTPEQFKACLVTGTPPSDIAAWQDAGFEFAEILDLCETYRDARDAEKSGDADRLAQANHKLNNPGNRTHPGISVFSRPKGERDDPKGEFVARKVLWSGTEEEVTTNTAEELDLVNAAASFPGDYKFTRGDGSRDKISVVVTRNDNGDKIELLEFRFVSRGVLRHNLPSKVAMLREILQQAQVALPASR